MAVGAAPLVSDPVGAQVAFLEDVNIDAARGGKAHGLGVDRARVAVEDDVGDRLGLERRG